MGGLGARRAVLFALVLAAVLSAPIAASVRDKVNPSPILPAATVGKAYRSTVTATFTDTPPAPDTLYLWKGTCSRNETDLPPGLSCKLGPGGKSLIVEGTPTEAGKYSWWAPARPQKPEYGYTTWGLQLEVKPAPAGSEKSADIEVKILQVAHVLDPYGLVGLRVKVWVHNNGPDAAKGIRLKCVFRVPPAEPLSDVVGCSGVQAGFDLASGKSSTDSFKAFWGRPSRWAGTTAFFSVEATAEKPKDPKPENNVAKGSEKLEKP